MLSDYPLNRLAVHRIDACGEVAVKTEGRGAIGRGVICRTWAMALGGLNDNLTNEYENRGCGLGDKDELAGAMHRHAVSELVRRPVEVAVHEARDRRFCECGVVCWAEFPANIMRCALGPRLHSPV